MNKFMKMAIQEATKGISNQHGGPFGSVVVKDGKVIAKGHNKVVKDNDPTLHGEIDAIRKACKKLGTYDLSGCTLYTTAAPCPMCLGAILWSNIEMVYYGCNVDDSEAIGFRDKKFYELDDEAKAKFIKELDRAECKKLFNKYQETEHSKY